MLTSATSATDNSTQLSYFTFWDMDDTCIELNYYKIKNPHLLLPILLFQTYAPNQNMAVLTNRTPNDDAVPYTVKMFREELLAFGIIIPEEHVVFGGGANARVMGEEYHSLKKGLNAMASQLNSLSLADKTNTYQSQEEALQRTFATIVAAKFEGKNFHIVNFLNAHLNSEKNRYKFNKGECLKTSLIVGMVDDLPNIASAVEKLGESFFGIQATPGGITPTDDSFKVDYLYLLANKIGFESYILSLVNFPEKHSIDHPMLKMAGLLFNWQISKEPTIASFEETQKRLTDSQCFQILNLLEYIVTLKIAHPNARYNPLDKLLNVFKLRAYSAFLNTFKEQFNAIDSKITQLASSRAIDNKAPALVKVKSKSLISMFSKTRAAEIALPVVPQLSETEIFLTALEEQKSALIERLKQIASSKFTELAQMANNHLLSILSVSSENPSTQASTSASLRPLVSEERRGFTPAADKYVNAKSNASSYSGASEEEKNKNKYSN